MRNAKIYRKLISFMQMKIVFKRSLAAWTMLVVGILLTLFASLQVKRDLEKNAIDQFAFACAQISLKIEERLGAYALILRGGAALFSTSDTVERSAWQAYVETLRASGSVPGVQGIGFAQRITPNQLDAHIAQIRGEGFPEYSVRPTGTRELYTSIIYLEPFSGRNLRAFGYDMFSEPVRRAAMEQARDTGEAALSGKVELVQETDQEVQAGTLMYVPVYRKGAPVATVAQRREALIGWAYSPYRMNDLMGGILSDWTNSEGKIVDLHIYAGREPLPANLLFDSNPATTPNSNALRYQQRTIGLADDQWLLVFGDIDPNSGISYATAWATLIGGLAFSGLVFGLMLSVLNTRANATRIADQLTEEIKERERLLKESDVFKVAILDSVNAEIVVLDRYGIIQAVNEPWRRFALENSTETGMPVPHTEVGANYLSVCQASTGVSSQGAVDAQLGIQAVLNGEIPSFRLEYPCHSPNIHRWFSMSVTPLGPERRGGVVVHTNITERKQAEDAVSEARNLLIKIIDTAPVRVFWKDRDLRYLGCNLAFAKDAGMRHPQDLIGKDDYQLVWVAQAERYRADDLAVLESGIDKLFYEEEQTTPSGQTIWLRTSKIPLRRHNNEIFGLLGVYEDVTEQKQAESELKRHREHLEELVEERTIALSVAKEAAEAANRAKSTFLANMSHELRTPMNAIMGMTAVLTRRSTNPQQIDQLNKVTQASQRLLGIITDILDLSKFEAERLSLILIDFNLGGVLKTLTRLTELKAAEKGLLLNIDVSSELTYLALKGDRHRLAQVLLNLAGNAIKFTTEGNVSVRASLVEENPTDVLLRFDVHDTGIGISAEDQRRLFTAFEQADGSMTRRYGGTGLGLALSKRLVQMMDGQIGVESQLGAGSLFWFTARFERAHQAIESTPEEFSGCAEEQLKACYAGARILLVEDEPLNQEFARYLLEDLGLKVGLAEDGDEAVAMARCVDYDLVLMDMQMPRMNGVAATRAIREISGRQRTPIIAMTAHVFDDDRQRCIDAGMDDHIGKPVDPDNLFRLLLRWLSKDR